MPSSTRPSARSSARSASTSSPARPRSSSSPTRTGDAEMIATDLLAQAEHDVRTRVGLITTDRALAEATLRRGRPAARDAVDRQHRRRTPGATMARSSLCADEAAMIAYSDYVAAEHLQVHTADPHAFAAKAAQLRLACSSASWPASSIPTSARHQPHAADDGRRALYRRPLGRLLCQDRHPPVARAERASGRSRRRPCARAPARGWKATRRRPRSGSTV